MPLKHNSVCSFTENHISNIRKTCFFFFGWPCFRYHPPSWVSCCPPPDPANLQHMSSFLLTSGSRHQVSEVKQRGTGHDPKSFILFTERVIAHPLKLKLLIHSCSSLRFKQTKLQWCTLFSLRHLKFVFKLLTGEPTPIQKNCVLRENNSVSLFLLPLILKKWLNPPLC